MHSARRLTAIVGPLAFGALLLHTSVASAVEARCPTGWSSLPAMSNGDQVIVSACRRQSQEIVASEMRRTIPANDPNERAIAEQMASQMSQGGEAHFGAFRSETWGGVAVRVADLSGTGTTEDGAQARLEGALVLVAASASTVIILAIDREAPPQNGTIRPAVRTFVPTIVGLGATSTPWRASASCPPNMPPWRGEAPPPGGARRVVRCGSPDSAQLDVVESRLLVRAADEARTAADLPAMAIRRAIVPIGGQVQIDTPSQITINGQRAFAIGVHGSASDPRAPPGDPSAGIHVEAYVVVLPMPTGNVRIIMISQSATAAAMQETVRSFVTSQLRTDGSGVVPEPPPGSAQAPTGPESDPDGGAMSSRARPPVPRPREIDPTLPIPELERETRPRASSDGTRRRSCGCRVVGACERPVGTEHAIAILAITGIALIARRTRRGDRARR